LAGLAGGGLQGLQSARTGTRHSHWRVAGKLAISTGELRFEKKNSLIKPARLQLLPYSLLRSSLITCC